VLNYTHGYASFAIKAAITPEVPHNAGSFRPIHVTAPRGSILNCVEPAAVASRHLIGHFLPGLIFGALAQALPGRLLAGGADPVWLSVWRGQRPTSGAPFMLSIFQCGGAGARASKDGLSATGFPSGVAGVPAEVIETLTPLVLHRRALRADSGGAGIFRGGLGQRTEMGIRGDAPGSLSAMVDRTRFAAQGIDGGAPGAFGELIVDGDENARPKALVALVPESHVQLNLPGGAGYGDPFARAPERVLADVVDGYVSLEAAEQEYGVVIRYLGAAEQLVRLPEHYAIDQEATALHRRPVDGK
jgi:N-methylhydantoinase B